MLPAPRGVAESVSWWVHPCRNKLLGRCGWIVRPMSMETVESPSDLLNSHNSVEQRTRCCFNSHVDMLGSSAVVTWGQNNGWYGFAWFCYHGNCCLLLWWIKVAAEQSNLFEFWKSTRLLFCLFLGCSVEWDNITCWPGAEIGEVVTIPCPKYLFYFSKDMPPRKKKKVVSVHEGLMCGWKYQLQFIILHTVLHQLN